MPNTSSSVFGFGRNTVKTAPKPTEAEIQKKLQEEQQAQEAAKQAQEKKP